MRPSTVLHVAGLILLAGSLAAWAATGREGYTRRPNHKLASADTPPSAAEDDLLADIGIETAEEREQTPTIESRFAFGLVPGGITPGHLPSVATAALCAGVLSASGLVISRGRRASTQASQPPQRSHP